jgi:hypothetical protein
VPQHIPLALLAAMPPIIAASIDAGSGPILRPNGASLRLAAAPMTPGCSAIVWSSPSPSIRQPRQLSPSSTSTESVTACPARLVPAARNVTGVPCFAASASSRTTSSSDSTTTASFGTRR